MTRTLPPLYITTRKRWSPPREASLNWIAFGLLLAAWNASDNDVGHTATVRRPAALRSHAAVSVRAATQHAVIQTST